MIELWTYQTPDGQKTSIMLEEVGLPYEVHAVDLMKGRAAVAGLPAHIAQQRDPRHGGHRRS
jgi:glutathione S-transferase